MITHPANHDNGIMELVSQQKELTLSSYYLGKENGILEVFSAMGIRTRAQWEKMANFAAKMFAEYALLDGDNRSRYVWQSVEIACRNYAEGAKE